MMWYFRKNLMLLSQNSDCCKKLHHQAKNDTMKYTIKYTKLQSII